MTLAVRVSGDGGTVDSTPAGIHCPGACAASFLEKTTVVLTASPDADHRFAGWTSDCEPGGTASTCTVALGAAGVTVDALVLPGGILQVAPRGPGTLHVSPPGLDASTGNPAPEMCDRNASNSSCVRAFPPGTAVTLTADPAAKLARWSDPDCDAGAATCTVTTGTAPKTLVATFQPLELHILRGVPEAGTVTSCPAYRGCERLAGIVCPDTCAAGFPAGSEVLLHAAPAAGHRFDGWNDCPDVEAGDCRVTLNDTVTLVGAIFDEHGVLPAASTIQVNFEVRKAGNGSGRVLSEGIDCGSHSTRSFTFDTKVTLRAQPVADRSSQTFAGGAG